MKFQYFDDVKDYMVIGNYIFILVINLYDERIFIYRRFYCGLRNLRNVKYEQVVDIVQICLEFFGVEVFFQVILNFIGVGIQKIRLDRSLINFIKKQKLFIFKLFVRLIECNKK